MFTLLTLRGVVTLTVLLAILGPSIAGCSDDSEEVGAKSQVIEGDGVSIRAPAGAVSSGAKLDVDRTVEEAPTEVGPFSSYHPLAQAVKIEIDEGEVQPGQPLIVSIDVEPISDETELVVAFIITDTNGENAQLLEATYDPERRVVTGAVPHLSLLWPIRVDLGDLANKGLDALGQTLGLSTQKPSCVDQEATLGNGTYRVIQPAQAWVCLRADRDQLRVDVRPNSPVPFTFTVSSAAQVQPTTDLGTATTLSTALTRAFGLAKTDEGIIGPGIGSQVLLKEAGSVDLKFEQEPGLLLLLILFGTLETLNISIDELDKAACVNDVVDTALQATSLSVSTASSVVTSFFSCVGEVVKLSPVTRVILGIISAAPQAFAGATIGAIQEVTGAGRFTVTIEETTTRPDSSASQSAQTGDAIDLAGTTWEGPDTYFGEVRFRFNDDGTVTTWTLQNGEWFPMESVGACECAWTTKDNTVTFTSFDDVWTWVGTVEGDSLSGTGTYIRGLEISFSTERIS